MKKIYNLTIFQQIMQSSQLSDWLQVPDGVEAGSSYYFQNTCAWEPFLPAAKFAKLSTNGSDLLISIV